MILFRLDLGVNVGGGHYARCKSIAQKLNGRDHSFLIRQCGSFDPRAFDLPNHKVLPHCISYTDEIEFINQNFGWPKIFVCDFTHAESLRDKDDIRIYLQQLNNYINSIVVIDGWGEGAIVDESWTCGCNILITPYVGVKRVRGVFRHLYGEQFFVMPNYSNEINKNITTSTIGSSEQKINLLLTFGQSDPAHLTEYVVRQIAQYLSTNRKIFTRIVLGKLFGRQRSRDLEELLVNLSIQYELIFGPESLQTYYEWADVAISASGLSKYEIAYFGLPAILLSATELDERLQTQYDAKEVAVHVGYFRNLVDGMLTVVLNDLVCDTARRFTMSENGKKMIDGRGADRIAAVLRHPNGSPSVS